MRIAAKLSLAVLGLAATPAAAMAAPAKIGPTAAPVSSKGVTSVEVANPNRHKLAGKATVTAGGPTPPPRHKLAGKATVTAGGRRVASRTVRLPKRSVTTVRLTLDARGLDALRAAGTQRATIAMKLSRAGGKAKTVRRTVTLSL